MELEINDCNGGKDSLIHVVYTEKTICKFHLSFKHDDIDLVKIRFNNNINPIDILIMKKDHDNYNMNFDDEKKINKSLDEINEKNDIIMNDMKDLQKNFEYILNSIDKFRHDINIMDLAGDDLRTDVNDTLINIQNINDKKNNIFHEIIEKLKKAINENNNILKNITNSITKNITHENINTI